MATRFSRARKGEPGGPEMRFAGAPTWDWSGRQKVSFNRSAALPRNGGRNGHPVTTNCDSASDNQRLELPAEASSERSRGDRSTPHPLFQTKPIPLILASQNVIKIGDAASSNHRGSRPPGSQFLSRLHRLGAPNSSDSHYNVPSDN